MKTLSDVSMEDVEMGRTGTHLIPTERELQVIYRALEVYQTVPVYHEKGEGEDIQCLLSILKTMGVKA